MPIIEDHRHHIESMTVSSQVGYCKPHPIIFDQVITKLNSTRSILFVDDQDKNLHQASCLGWKTLQADAKGNWIEKVMLLLLDT